jgi:hypothetical protein
LDYLNPSSIDMQTLRNCLAGFGDDFLEGVGLEPLEVETLRALRASRAPVV